MRTFYKEYCSDLTAVLAALDINNLEKILKLIEDSYESQKTIYLIGNGGSSATASHWVCDFAKGINVPNAKRMSIFCLSDNIPLLSAIANDISYDKTFSEQLINCIKPGDILISLTVSGNSQNLINAHIAAHEMGAHTAAIVGDYNGRLAGYSDITLVVPSRNYGVVEDVHSIVGHLISQYIKRKNSDN